MKLTTVTITGADDKTPVFKLLEISETYPFVEWGILLSSNHKERPRYPTDKWISSLEPLSQQGVAFSGHICGAMASSICKGIFPLEADLPLFKRIQLNIACFYDEIDELEVTARCLPDTREYIIQVGFEIQKGLSLARGLSHQGLNTSVLFDASGGRGVTPREWPETLSEMRCGFAGGLGPHNLENQLSKLALKSGDTHIWIDMESMVRSDDNQQLDFTKAQQCLEICRPYST